MRWRQAILDPLQGRSSLSRIIWGYGLLGSVVVAALGAFVDSGNEVERRGYSLFGLLYGVYLSVALYQCAPQGRSATTVILLRISAVLSLVLILVLGYLDFSGALGMILSGIE